MSYLLLTVWVWGLAKMDYTWCPIILSPRMDMAE